MTHKALKKKKGTLQCLTEYLLVRVLDFRDQEEFLKTGVPTENYQHLILTRTSKTKQNLTTTICYFNT